VGPWYVLADEQIPSGESLVRNLLLGGRDARALGGRLEVMYSPDAFGHPAVWPTLAAEFALRHGALWRGLGDAGVDLVRWTGADGGTVLVYHLPPDGYEVGSALPADPTELRRVWPSLRDVLATRAATSHVAVLVGADHHALHPALGDLRDALAALEPDAEVRVSRLDEYLTLVEREAEVAGSPLPELLGELRWSYGYTWTLQGVHGTRAHQKRRNAGVELLLERSAEPLAALAMLARGRTRSPGAAALLEHAWRTLVRAHFHDTLGGCCADGVARAADRRFEDAEQIAGEIAARCGDALIGHDPDAVRRGEAGPGALVLWNPAARRRGGVVVAELTAFRRDVLVGPPSGRAPRTGPPLGDVAIVAPDASAIPVQVLHRDAALERRDAPHHYPDLDEVDRVRVAFRAPEVGGLGTARLGVAAAATGAAPAAWAGDVRVTGAALSNDLVSVGFTADGRLLLTDRRSGEHWTELLGVESEHDVGDTYTVQPGRWRVAQGDEVSVRVLAEGPLVGALEARTALRLPTGSVSLAVRVELRAGEPAVRLSLALDNRATDHRLRLRIPVGLGGAAVAGGQFGALRRDPVVVRAGEFARETPVATAPAHRFVGAARGARGLALLAPGFFEYEWTPDGDLLFTVLRAVGELSRGDLATRPGNAGWATATPEAQVQGTDRLQLALLPLTEAALADEAALLAAWEEVFLPVRGIWHRETTAPTALPPCGVELEGEGLVFSACKPALEGEGVILRCWNATDRRVRGRWRLAVPVASAERTRADETPVALLRLEGGGHVVPFEAPPRGIVTVRVTPERGRS
jgi:alpha-mannosidase